MTSDLLQDIPLELGWIWSEPRAADVLPGDWIGYVLEKALVRFRERFGREPDFVLAHPDWLTETRIILDIPVFGSRYVLKRSLLLGITNDLGLQSLQARSNQPSGDILQIHLS